MKFKTFLFLVLLSVTLLACHKAVDYSNTSNELAFAKANIKKEKIGFQSDGIQLAGTIYSPENPDAAVVLVHGSDSVPRMSKMAQLLAQENIMVLTYDKRGVGASEGIYVGPEVGTNNISVANLNVLANDASAAVNFLRKKNKEIPIGLFGASQAGWIIPMAADKNPLVDFMVVFSGPTITTLEQLRFQFYTNGSIDFWENHTEAEAREHVQNDPDRYQFEPTDPKDILQRLAIPGLWLFGEKDIQIPVKMCIEDLNTLQLQNKAYDYVLFPSLGHSTYKPEPIDISIHWIKRQSSIIQKLKH